MIDPAYIERLVASPSVGAIAYQCLGLIQELTRINDDDYPTQTRCVRDVLLCVAEHCLEQLWELYDEDHPCEPKGGMRGAARLRSLGKLIQEMYSYIRYLSASSPRQSPPAIQFAVSELTALHFPKDCGEALCVVRPQWKYNLKCVPLTSQLRAIVSPAVLDPDKTLGADTFEEILEVLWHRPPKIFEKIFIPGRSRPDPPKQLAILSFAGLDTNDTLCYPLLAHELGHFIDFSRKPPLHLSDDLKEKSQITHEQIENILKTHWKRDPDPGEVDSYRNLVVQRTYVCLRELLADLLATRMMGFSFFIVQSEFLKTLFSWNEPRITPSGYPGFQFRIWSILRHLLADEYEPNPLTFLKGAAQPEAAILVRYLEEWSDRLRIQENEPPLGTQSSSNSLQNDLFKIAEDAVKNTLESLTKVAQTIIPDTNCAVLTPRFFERITMLTQELPPYLESESPQSFAEIMSAAWAYQILYGETNEANKNRNTVEKKYEEYAKTCRLILKAIELLPTANGKTTQPEQKAAEVENANEDWLSQRGVLSAAHIQSRIALPIDHPSHLAALPLKTDSIKAASIDVHLGNWFAYARRTKLNEVMVGDAERERLLMTIGREEVFIPADKQFLLHPGDLVLGVTEEFFALPNDVMAFVEGRSGLGRLGLFVATATQVAPGYHGVIVLELANAGTVPLKLEPGMAIAQLVLQAMTDPTKGYYGRYHCQIKP